MSLLSTAIAMLLAPLKNAALDAGQLLRLTAPHRPAATKHKPRSAGSKLSRKASSGMVGVARIK